MKRFRLSLLAPLLTVIILLCFSSGAWSATKESHKTKSKLPSGTLTASQIKHLFSGKTVVANVAGKKTPSIFYFSPKGKVWRVRKGWQKVGHWKTRKDGRLCVKYKGAQRDCRIIIKKGNAYQQYAVKKSGNHRLELTYTRFLDGNQLTRLSKKPILPVGTLRAKEVVKLFSGQTVESVTARKGRISHSYYNPDGTLEQSRNGVKRSGKWRVKKNGRICLQFSGLKEKCRIIVKEDGQIKKYIVKKNGRHQHSVSYRNFTPGRHL